MFLVAHELLIGHVWMKPPAPRIASIRRQRSRSAFAARTSRPCGDRSTFDELNRLRKPPRSDVRLGGDWAGARSRSSRRWPSRRARGSASSIPLGTPGVSSLARCRAPKRPWKRERSTSTSRSRRRHRTSVRSDLRPSSRLHESALGSSLHPRLGPGTMRGTTNAGAAPNVRDDVPTPRLTPRRGPGATARLERLCVRPIGARTPLSSSSGLHARRIPPRSRRPKDQSRTGSSEGFVTFSTSSSNRAQGIADRRRPDPEQAAQRIPGRAADPTR